MEESLLPRAIKNKILSDKLHSPDTPTSKLRWNHSTPSLASLAKKDRAPESPLLDEEDSDQSDSEDDVFSDNENNSEHEKSAEDSVIPMVGDSSSKKENRVFEKTQSRRMKEAKKSEWWGPYLVICVTLAIVLVYISAWIVIVTPHRRYWFGSLIGLLNFIFGHFLLVMICVNYYYLVSTNPGTNFTFKPTGTQLELEKAKHDKSVLQKWIRDRYFLKIRYCHTCHQYMPPRSHHCKVCRKCVLRMDHHCPWANNCIGLRNHKYFLGFLFYTCIAIVYICLGFIISISASIFNGQSISVSMILSMIASTILIIFFSTVTFVRFGNGLYLATQNKTKIELWHAHWAHLDLQSKGKVYTYPYDKGSSPKNLTDFLGNYWFFLPVAYEEGGLSYPNLVDLD